MKVKPWSNHSLTFYENLAEHILNWAISEEKAGQSEQKSNMFVSKRKFF